MYVYPNFKTKKALKEAVARGGLVDVFAPGMGTPKVDGWETVEGPHFPQAHTWYAMVLMEKGRVVKVR